MKKTMEKNETSVESLCQQGMQLSMGLILGNGLLCPLIIPGRTVIEGLAIGAIAAMISLGIYSYQASRLSKEAKQRSEADAPRCPSASEAFNAKSSLS